MKAFRFFAVALLLLLSAQSIFAGRYYDSKTGRFLSVDPKADKYPGISPYTYCLNNPLLFIDPDGQDVAFFVDKNGAGDNGHTTLYFQDKSGQWYSFDQGAAGQPSSGGDYGYISGQSTDAGVVISTVSGVPKGSLLLHTTSDQDDLISQNAFAVRDEHNNGDSKYNLYSNNCTDAAVDVVNNSGAGVTVENSPTTVRPNEWFKELKQAKVKIVVSSGEGVDNTKVVIEVPKYEEVK